MRKLSLLLVLMLFSAAQLLAQRTITGTVRGDDGKTLPSATILVNGDFKQAAQSDVDGKYSIKVPANGKFLRFSFIGMKSEDVAISNSNVINVELSSEAKQIEGVVISVPFGTAKKETFTGSATTISKPAGLKPLSNITKAFEGASAGVQINANSGQPGAGSDVRIRGFGSINYSSAPLYIVDGAPYVGDISSINPDDIEDMSILKDAASTALYGNRAANGVIIIKTRKGLRGRHEVSVRATQGFSTRALPEYSKVDAAQYYPLMWEALRNSYLSGGKTLADANNLASFGDAKNYSIFELLGYNPFNVPDNQIVGTDGKLNPNAKLKYDDFDWYKDISRIGSRGDYGINFNGGNEKSDYFMSFGYLNEKGFIINSDYERYSARLNLNTNPKTWLKAGSSISATLSKGNNANTDGSSSYVNPFMFARGIGPIYPVYAHDPVTGELLKDQFGEKIYDLGNPVTGVGIRPGGGYSGRHIVAETMLNERLTKKSMLSIRPYVEIKFLKDFSFNTTVGYDLYNNDGKEYWNTLVGDGAPAGKIFRTLEKGGTFNISEVLTYNKQINNHIFDVVLGHENNKFTYNYVYGARSNIVSLGNTELINFTQTTNLTSYEDNVSTEGFFSKLNYSYADKYFGSLSFRRDGSSKFYKDSRWGNFWSVGAGWNIHKEDFMKDFTWINQLKLRSSYGEVGNNAGIGYYASQGLYALNWNNANEPGIMLSNLANNALTWETNTNFDIGLDYGFLNDRINGTIEYYQKKSTNLLFDVPLPLSGGMESITQNIGSMTNKGIELSLNAVIINNKDFKWTTKFNLTTVRNEITKLPQSEIITGTKKLMVGHSMYDYWLREYYGVNSANGDALYRANIYDATTPQNYVIIGSDTLTNNQNNARYHYAGSAIPDFGGGITNILKYKDVTLEFLFTYSVGGKIYDQMYASQMHAGNYGASWNSDILNRWTPENPNSNIPRLDNSKTTPFGAGSDRWLIDASYLKLKSATLSYTFPSKIASQMYLSNLRVYVSGDNLWQVSKRKGLNVGEAFSGVLSNVYTPARIITFGLNLTF